LTLVRLDEHGFDAFVRPGPALAGFWAEWSLPSRSLQPLLEAVAADFHGRLRVGLADHDANPGLSERYRIQGLPTLILFQGGAEVQRRVGLMDRAAVHEMVKEALG
jgi:thioredoxin-like negative regulator of GroEL